MLEVLICMEGFVLCYWGYVVIVVVCMLCVAELYVLLLVKEKVDMVKLVIFLMLGFIVSVDVEIG